MNKAIDVLIENLKNILGVKLSSVFIYGSSALAKDLTKTSDINCIVIVDNITAEDLKLVSPAIKIWMKSKNPLPIFMGKQEWQNSADVYPMEYSDIMDRHKILFGEDLISSLEIEKCNLRLQCESETKNLLIRLRQNYLANSSDKKAIAELIVQSSKSFMAIFRTILKLVSDHKIPIDKEEVIGSVSSHLEIEKQLFVNVIKFRDDKKAINKDELEIVIQKLIDSTYEILKFVDKLYICKEK